MSVDECMKRVRHREYLAWMAKFREEWNEPSRSDYYLMQIAAAMIRMKKGGLDQLKIPFKFKEGPTKEEAKMTAETATELAKARWKTRLGASRG